MYKWLRFSTIVVILLLLLTACGGTRSDYDEYEPEDEVILAGTLTILAMDAYSNIIRTTEDAMRPALGLWGDRADELELDIEYYTIYERYQRMTRLQVEIMAGIMPDIVFMMYNPAFGSVNMDNNPTWAVLNSGVLACFYQLIDRDPYSSIDDFFCNALRRWEINGRLHTFPMALGLKLVSINSTLPPSIVNRFTAKESITIGEFIRLNLDLREHYPEFGHMYPRTCGGNRPSCLLRPVLNGFIDFDNSVSHLNDSRFIEFLYDWHSMFSGRDIYSHVGARFMHPTVREFRSAAASEIAFITNLREHAFFPELNPYFIHSIPLTDEHGRLITDELDYAITVINGNITGGGRFIGSWALPIISVNANGPLAWEFMKHAADAFAGSTDTDSGAMYLNSFNTTIVRSQAERQMTRALGLLLARYCGAGRFIRDDGHGASGVLFESFFDSLQEQNMAIDAIFDRVNTIADMPFATPSFVPFALYEEILNTFLRMQGSITDATATAQELHNRVSLWLIE